MSSLTTIDLPAETERMTQFIAQAFRHSHKQTAVIAVSGGIDSATSLMLTAKALGPENIHSFHLPSKTSHPIHLEDAQKVAQASGLPDTHFHIISIGAIIQKTWRIINHYAPHSEPRASSSETNRLRLANLAARIRMLALYDQAKRYDALVIGTENLSEHLLGYFTRFGDEASDLEPIRHLYKTQVIDLAAYLNVPDSIITKKPSADLWPGQTDAAELGFTYEQADPILYLHTQGQSETDIVNAGHDLKLVQAVLNQVKNSTFKHRVPYHLTEK